MVWLLRKEWRELLVSRSWWLLLLLMGPLTGLSFIAAANTYAEVSGLNGTAQGVGEAMAPLTGVWAPTFSACELAAVFLLPFVAIRMVGNDRISGALKLELQGKLSPAIRIGVKAVVALAGWMIVMLPACSAFLLWKIYGGTLYAPELFTLVAGHLLNAGLTIALGFAAASLTEHPSTAAIATLGITVGTWIINFFAALNGGLWEKAAAFTPAAVVADFQHGLLRMSTSLVSLVLVLTGLGIASIWQRIGVRSRKKTAESFVLLFLATLFAFSASIARPSWDLSESRANSFPVAEERALQSIPHPLQIIAHLAPEDPRRADLEHNVFSKLRRTVPDLTIRFVSATSIGLFEQNTSGYGEIEYLYQSRKETNRVTTADGVLESIYTITATQIPQDTAETVFRGHPLAVPPRGAAAVFYGVWPVSVLVCGLITRRRFHSL